MIGIPVLTGMVDFRFIECLLGTISMAPQRGYQISLYWVGMDPLVQRARNEIMQVAYDSGVKKLFFIDSDIIWKPKDLFDLLDHPQPVIGAGYKTKQDDDDMYPHFVGCHEKSVLEENGLKLSTTMGMGFVKLTRSAWEKFYEDAPVYKDHKDGRYRKHLFEVGVVSHDLFVDEHGSVPTLMGEDLKFYRDLKEKYGVNAYVDTKIQLGHIGTKIYTGVPYKFLSEHKYDKTENLSFDNIAINKHA